MAELRKTTKELNTFRLLILCAVVILLEEFDTQAAVVSATKITPRIQWLKNLGGISMRVQRIAVFLTVFSIGCLSRLPTQQANINVNQ
jgi:cell division protein ZapA (FtsZ GTPase activity inhibitor)